MASAANRILDFQETRPIPMPLQLVVDQPEPKDLDQLVSATLEKIEAEAMDRGAQKAKSKKSKSKKSKKAKRSKKSSAPKQEVEVGSRRGIESMLRNSYRAQLSMIALAARKANIMISVNGFLLSLLTVSSAYILTTEPLLLIPSSIFLITCILAILFAVLAARPQKVNNSGARPKDFREGNADLLVFEQFAHLSRDDHMSVMLDMMKDKERIYRSMVAHLHFLGRSAKRRFDLLQISYSVFLVGLILSFSALGAVTVLFYL